MNDGIRNQEQVKYGNDIAGAEPGDEGWGQSQAVEFRLYPMGSRGSREIFHLGLAWPNQSLIDRVREGLRRSKPNREIPHRLKQRFRRVKQGT